jgi:hypothetical protein
MELIDLKANTFLRDEHTKNRQNLLNFYRLLPADDFPELRAHAQRIFCMFGSTYTCEQTFSKMKFIKSAQRSRLTDEHLQYAIRGTYRSYEEITQYTYAMIRNKLMCGMGMWKITKQ